MSNENKEAGKMSTVETTASGLRTIGCASVTIFRGGGMEAKFDDGSIMHVASCASSFLLQLPPHRDTPYGCGLHKIEYKTKFPTSLCRRKIRELIDLRNKQCGDNKLYISHGDVKNSVGSSENTLEACLYGKKLPKRIEQYSWQYEDIARNSDGSLSLWDTEKVARITLRPHRQSIDVRFLVPKSENGSNSSELAKSNSSSVSQLKKSEDVSVKYVAVSPRLKSVANKEESLSSLRINLLDRLNEADEPNQNESNIMDGSGETGKKNWHQYVWVTQFFSVMAVPECWRGATSLIVHYSRHSFINGASSGISPQPVISHPDFDNWVLADSCCSAYLHPWRQIKGFMESRESTALWDSHPISAFVIPDFIFRIIYPGDDSLLSEPIVEVDLPDGSLLRSESSSNSDLMMSSLPFNQSVMTFQNTGSCNSSDGQPPKTLFLTHFSYKSSIENVKSVTISLSNPPPKVPGQMYDLGHIGRQAFDLLAAVNSLQSIDGKEQQIGNSCVKTISASALEDSEIFFKTARSGCSDSTAPTLAPDDNFSLATPRLLGPYVTEQAQVEGVGEFWAYSTRRIRIAFCDGVFLDMKLMNTEGTDRANSGGETSRSNSSIFSSGSTSAADLPVGLARMLMKDGTYQFVNINNPPAQFTRYLLAAGEWIQWIECPEEDRETSFTSANQIQTLVQWELDKIKRFNYIKDNTVKLSLSRPEPIGGPALKDDEESCTVITQSENVPSSILDIKDNTVKLSLSRPEPIGGPALKDDEESCTVITEAENVPSSILDKKSLPNVESIEDFAEQISAKSTPIVVNAGEQKIISLETPVTSGRHVKIDSFRARFDSERVEMHTNPDVHAHKADCSSEEAQVDSKHTRIFTPIYNKKSSKFDSRLSYSKESQPDTPIRKLGSPSVNGEANTKTPGYLSENAGVASDANTPANTAINNMQSSDDASSVSLKTVENSSGQSDTFASPKESLNEKTETDSEAQPVLSENSSRVARRKKNSLQSETNYKQSELQSEIQKIIQKTRQDLELFQSPQNLRMLDLSAKSEKRVTDAQKTSNLQRAEIKAEKAVATCERELCVVPPPSDFADKDSADHSFKDKSQINESLISRPKSPPPSASIEEKNCPNGTSSPPRSPPGARNTIMTGNSGGSSHTDGKNVTQDCSETFTASLNGVPKLNLSSTNQESGEEGSLKTAFATENESINITKSVAKEKTVLPDISLLQIEFDSVAQQKRDLIRPSNDIEKGSITKVQNHKSEIATSFTQSDKSLKRDESKTVKSEGSIQSNDALQDVDRFIQENSAGLDVKFDFASVTDALFKTQQAIKTIEDMLGQRKGDQHQSSSDRETTDFEKLNGTNDTIVEAD